jgi:DNA-binding SARP family transcriptional activator
MAGDRVAAAIGPGEFPVGGVGLTGPGALAAGRGILTAVLLTANAEQPNVHTRLITTAGDLDTLLGPDAAAHHPPPGLVVADTLDEAATLLEQEVLQRGRLAATRAGTGAAPATSDRDLAPLVLLAGAPSDQATATRLAVALLCSHLGVAGALLGTWPHGQTWRVDSNGYIDRADATAAAGGRLCVLTRAAACDLLTLLRELHHNPDRPLPAGVSGLGTHGPDPAGDAAVDARPDIDYRVPAPRASAHPAITGPDGAPGCLQLRLLGTPVLARATGEPVVLQRTASLHILIFLAVHRAGATSSQLIAVLWPGPRPQAAANRLYTPVNRLRTALREAAGADVLIRDSDRYRLDDQHLDVDLWRLHAAADRAATAIDPTEHRRALHMVINAYTADLAADKDWSWLASPREAARRQVIDAYAALADAEPDPHTALTLLQDAVRVDPLNTDLQRRARHAHSQVTAPATQERSPNTGPEATNPHHP